VTRRTGNRARARPSPPDDVHRGRESDPSQLPPSSARRRPISAGPDDDVRVSGDPDLFRHWVEHTAHRAG
jgi:hypothetical protein